MRAILWVMRFLRLFFQWLGVLLLMYCIAVSAYLVHSKRTTDAWRGALSDRLDTMETALADIASTTRLQLDAGTQRDTTLSDLVYNQQKQIDEIAGNIEGFDRKVGRLSGTVQTLEKLTTTDPELLQKYSRIYFLNEHYKPSDLVVIDESFDLVNGKEVSIHADVWPFLKDMLEDARKDEVDIMVLSGYRSFEDQGVLKTNYTQRYGTGANTFSADQGYSEHQLGTTVDLTNTTIGENIADFEQTKAFTWLSENAYKYGFVLSYPRNNGYYVYEPWHWRFVGKELARYLHKKELYFYDLEQRTIDEYIPTLFED